MIQTNIFFGEGVILKYLCDIVSIYNVILTIYYNVVYKLEFKRENSTAIICNMEVMTA